MMGENGVDTLTSRHRPAFCGTDTILLCGVCPFAVLREMNKDTSKKFFDFQKIPAIQMQI